MLGDDIFYSQFEYVIFINLTFVFIIFVDVDFYFKVVEFYSDYFVVILFCENIFVYVSVSVGSYNNDFFVFVGVNEFGYCLNVQCISILWYYICYCSYVGVN